MTTRADPEPIEERLEELYERHRRLAISDVATFYEPGRGYCSEAETVGDNDQFAISVVATDGRAASVGDHELPFAMQSVSKVFAYALALADHGSERVLQRVGVEPSGDAFTAIEFDERNKRPHNPMVNAGAMVTSDLVRGRTATEKLERILASMSCYAGGKRLEVDRETFKGELVIADHNRAIAYLMRAQGMIAGDVEATLGLYLQQCSVSVTCDDLALMAATLANGGVNPATGRRCLERERVRDVISVMYTCGMYDFAGQWAYEIGVPAKSGVNGAIMCVIPEKLGLAVFSPGLDPYGNSVRGVNVCREVADRLGLHVFATEEEDLMLGDEDGAAA